MPTLNRIRYIVPSGLLASSKNTACIRKLLLTRAWEPFLERPHALGQLAVLSRFQYRARCGPPTTALHFDMDIETAKFK